jgi:peptide deformylase
MSLPTIRTYGDPCLKVVSEPIGAVDAPLRALIDAMQELMYASKGVGLAAPQVGENVRLFVIDVDWVDREDGQEQGQRNLKVFINPEITWESPEDASVSEGCLSVPGIESNVYRPVRVRMRYLDENGAAHEREMADLEARCVQHELDHLDGVLFVDRIPFVRRQMLAGKLSILKKRQHEAAETLVTQD